MYVYVGEGARRGEARGLGGARRSGATSVTSLWIWYLQNLIRKGFYPKRKKELALQEQVLPYKSRSRWTREIKDILTRVTSLESMAILLRPRLNLQECLYAYAVFPEVFASSSIDFLGSVDIKCEQRGLWSDCAYTQSDLSLQWSHWHIANFVLPWSMHSMAWNIYYHQRGISLSHFFLGRYIHSKYHLLLCSFYTEVARTLQWYILLDFHHDRCKQHKGPYQVGREPHAPPIFHICRDKGIQQLEERDCQLQ